MELIICSGGQSGADLAGITAAYDMKITTSGHMPRGCLTENGPRPEYIEKFNLVEGYGDYKWRTHKNVEDSDGTIIFVTNKRSSGTICTVKGAVKHKKPYLLIDLNDPCEIADAVEWVKSKNINKLNIAGHRESICPGIFNFTYGYVKKMLEILES